MGTMGGNSWARRGEIIINDKGNNEARITYSNGIICNNGVAAIL